MNVSQVWCADNASTTRKLGNLRSWLNQLQAIGPDFGFHPNSVKTWLVAKAGHLCAAEDLFGNTAVNITFECHPYQGAPLGTENYA